MVNSEIRQKGTREAFETLETNLECTYLLSSQVGVQGKDQLSNINIYMSHIITTDDPHSEILELSKKKITNLSRGDFVKNWS